MENKNRGSCTAGDSPAFLVLLKANSDNPPKLICSTILVSTLFQQLLKSFNCITDVIVRAREQTKSCLELQGLVFPLPLERAAQ